MELLNNIFGDSSLTVFVLTLMHSLWIAALVSALTAILFILVIKSARIRYIIAVGGLGLTFILTVSSYIKLDKSLRRSSVKEISLSSVTDPADTTATNTGTAAYDKVKNDGLLISLLQAAEKSCTAHSGLLALIWMSGVIVMGTRFTGTYVLSCRYKSYGTTDLPEEWNKKIRKIAGSISLEKNVKVVQSLIATVPMVSGWIKPVIVLPASIISGIPAAQLEAIITHELAHIKRNDYLVNILQSLIEIIMFYNPAVWWISGLIRNEREKCCDDITLIAGNERIIYAKALISIQEIQGTSPAPALSVKNNNLINRIKRITTMKSNNFYSKEKWIAFTGLAIMLALPLLVSGFTSCNTASASEMNQSVNPDQETLMNEVFKKGHDDAFALYQDTLRLKESARVKTTWTDPADNIEKDVRMNIEKGEVTELIIDGNIIPENEYDNYRGLIDKTIRDYTRGMEKLAAMDFDRIEKDIEEAMEKIENMDFDRIEKDVEEAMEKIENMDFDRIEKDVEESMKKIENMDFERMVRDAEAAMEKIGNMDFDRIVRDAEDAVKELEEIDFEEIERNIRENMHKIDVEEMLKDIEENIRKIEKTDLKNIEIKMREALESMDENYIEIARQHSIVTPDKTDNNSFEDYKRGSRMTPEEMKTTLRTLENKNK